MRRNYYSTLQSESFSRRSLSTGLCWLCTYSQSLVLLYSAINVFRSTYFVQGILDRRRNRPEAAEASFMEAQNMWFKGDQTRLHPFNAGCIYKTGVVCLDQGKVEAAMYVSLASHISFISQPYTFFF